MTLTERMTHYYWLVSLQDRRHLPVYQLSREDLCLMSRNGMEVRQELLDHMDVMPARLVERLAVEMERW